MPASGRFFQKWVFRAWSRSSQPIESRSIPVSVGEEKTNINKEGYACESAYIPGQEISRRFECGPRPATPDRTVRVFLACPCHRGGGAMTASARQHPPKRVPVLRSPVASSPSRDDDSQLCGGQQPFFCSKSIRGRRPQRPGNQSRKRVSGSFPPAIPSREPPVPPALPQSSGLARNSHVSLHTLSITSLRPAIQKTLAVVQNLWTPRLPCGSTRKSKTEL